ncbi:MAG: T9SS type A sorting domain-containing protein [Bacteroidetes bacterium]|nr:T9SS type A sorting domain-containing protein [Bacteroidota bacterium]
MRYLYFLTYMSLCLMSSAQITITQADMPAAGDTIRISLTSNVPGNYTLAGNSVTWDFSSLESQNQQVVEFVSATSTPTIYWLVFTPNLVTNLASPGGDIPFPMMPVSNYYDYYNKTSGAFQHCGFAFQMSGIPFPVKYASPDEWYQFPLTMGNTYSSLTTSSVVVPGMGYYGTSKDRQNVVDAWGTVITPFGSFQSLRVKSELQQFDSLYIDSLNIGFPVNRVITEYKWLAAGMGIPVLTVVEEGPAVTARYIDHYIQPPIPLTVEVSPDTTICFGQSVTLAAAASGGVPPYNFVWSTFEMTPEITVTPEDTTSYYVIAYDAAQNMALDTAVVNVKECPGFNEMDLHGVTINPNPANEYMEVTFPAGFPDCILTIIDPTGKILEKQYRQAPGSVKMDVSMLPPGLYLLKIQAGEQRGFLKMMIK